MLTALGQSELASSTAEALASGDAAALILLGRSQADVQPIFDTINGKYPEVKVIFITVEVCKLASVRGAADILGYSAREIRSARSHDMFFMEG